MPTFPETLIVPPRIPFSWLPPCIKGSIFTPSLTYKKPAPLGPENLWLLALNKSIFALLTSIGICPKAWTASVWKSTLCFFAIIPICSIGCNVPISLFAVIMLINMVFFLIAEINSLRFKQPFSSTFIYVIS